MLLGTFTLGFFFSRVRGGSAFWALLIGEATVIAIGRFTNIAFLWYNVIGAVVVVVSGVLISRLTPAAPPSLSSHADNR